jgi:hypothetical protein
MKPVKLSNNAGYKYKKTATELYDIYKENKWIDEDIDLINPDKPTPVKDSIELQEENAELKRQIEELKKQLQQQVDIKPKKSNKIETDNKQLHKATNADELDEWINGFF